MPPMNRSLKIRDLPARRKVFSYVLTSLLVENPIWPKSCDFHFLALSQLHIRPIASAGTWIRE